MSAALHGTATRLPSGPTGPHTALTREISGRLMRAFPGLLAAEPEAVRHALAVGADVLGEVLGQAMLGLSAADYQDLAVRALVRAHHVAAARQDAARYDAAQAGAAHEPLARRA